MVPRRLATWPFSHVSTSPRTTIQRVIVGTCDFDVHREGLAELFGLFEGLRKELLRRRRVLLVAHLGIAQRLVRFIDTIDAVNLVRPGDGVGGTRQRQVPMPAMRWLP